MYQMKFTKDLNQEKALVTTDFTKFYCTRKPPYTPLKGFEKEHKFCLNAFKRYQIERIVVHQGKESQFFHENVRLVSKSTEPGFFDVFKLNCDVWSLLESIQQNEQLLAEMDVCINEGVCGE